MKKLLTNAKIIDKTNNKFKNVNILINDNIIEKIFENDEKSIKNQDILTNFDDVEEIDCKNNIVLSGFVNSNSNLIKNFFENFFEFNEEENFDEEYEKFLDKLSMEEKYNIYKFQIFNLIKNGITTFSDEDLYNLSLKKAVKEIGINCVYRFGYKNCFDELNNDLVRKSEKSGEDFVFYLGGVLENSEENFDEIIKLAKFNNKPIFVGGAENLEKAGLVESEFSKTTTEMLESYGVLDVRHCILNNNVLDKSDYEILSNYNSNLIFSPSLNLTFGYKNANIYALNQTNLIGLSSFKNNYILEMYLASILEKESYNKFEIFQLSNLFEFSSINNATILGLENVGEIKENNRADLLVVECDKLFVDVNSFLKNFENDNIKSVLINGKVIYNLNHFVEDKSYEHIKNVCLNILKKYNKN